MTRISRKAATLSAAGVIALAGIGGVVGHTAAHAAGPVPAAQMAQMAPEAVEAPESTAPDTDTIQSQTGDQVQSGSQSRLDTP